VLRNGEDFLLSISDYKLSSKAYKYLSQEQKENLYSDNIYMQVETFVRNKKITTRGVLIAYDMYSKPFVLPVKKIIPELLQIATSVVCLPKELKESISVIFDNWTYGKTFLKKREDGTLETVHKAYYYMSGRYKETLPKESLVV